MWFILLKETHHHMRVSDTCMMLGYNAWRFITYIHNVLTLLAADSAVSRLEPVGGALCSCFLHPCWVSTAALFSTRWAWRCFGLCHYLYCTPLPWTGFGIPGTGQHPGSLSGTVTQLAYKGQPFCNTSEENIIQLNNKEATDAKGSSLNYELVNCTTCRAFPSHETIPFSLGNFCRVEDLFSENGP
jgi:hypothetical protein